MACCSGKTGIHFVPESRILALQGTQLKKNVKKNSTEIFHGIFLLQKREIDTSNKRQVLYIPTADN